MTADPEVTHNEGRHRYELVVDGHTAIAVYRLNDGVATFTHTEVPPEIGGRGVASRLIAAALADAREQGWKIVPLCPFVKRHIEKHPELADLVAG
ncbi:MAG: GNAT family N-acetyltransferase [Sphingomonadales bacterium]